ncbi:MAG: hypothetical protein AB8H86_30895 [Polyangiales bacterium]
MPERSSDLLNDSPVYLRRFLNHFSVECPRCPSRAKVVLNAEGTPRVSCLACAHIHEGWAPPDDAFVEQCKKARCSRCNEWLGDASMLYRASDDELDIHCACGATRTKRLPRRWLTGVPVDPYLRLPLWLRCAVGAETLWAYNVEHLDFLHSYLSGTLRKRTPNEKSSLVTRLPAWMKSAKRRDDVLKGLARLQQRASE